MHIYRTIFGSNLDTHSEKPPQQETRACESVGEHYILPGLKTIWGPKAKLDSHFEFYDESIGHKPRGSTLHPMMNLSTPK